MVARNDYDLVDRTNLSHELEVFFLFLLSYHQRINSQALFVSQDSKDVASRHAAERIKSIFREGNPMARGDCLPGLPMQRHGVGERPVAVENQPFDISHDDRPPRL